MSWTEPGSDSGRFRRLGWKGRTGALLMLLALANAAGAECPAIATTSIHAVKGYATPQVPKGKKVTVEGIVTGNFLGRDRLRGFYLQAPALPGNTLPAGVFVYAPRLEAKAASAVVPGTRLQLTGKVAEFKGQIQLSHPDAVRKCDTGALPKATPLRLPATPERLKRLEGLRVRLPQPLTVTGHGDLQRFGTLDLAADGRLFRPTNTPGIDPGSNARRRILLDDGSYRARPKPIPYLGRDRTRRAGSRVTDLTGILAYGFRAYRVHPTEPPSFQDTNPRPPAPAGPTTGWRIGVFNVENYFTTPGRRGAASRRELQRQTDKLLQAMHAMEADVLALMEIENSDKALRALVGHLNRGAPRRASYRGLTVPDGSGKDAIRVALVYRADRLEAIGPVLSDPDPIHSRPPAAAIFRPRYGHGRPFGVIAVHFKSKSGCPERGDVDRGQGCWNHRRGAQAEALARFIRRIVRETGTDDLLVAGDLNAYGNEEPVRVLRASRLTDLVAAHLAPEGRYTYVYRGESGYLDHAMATPELARRVRNVKIWHINADEPSFLSYSGEPDLIAADAYRSSDHDPILIDLE